MPLGGFPPWGVAIISCHQPNYFHPRCFRAQRITNFHFSTWKNLIWPLCSQMSKRWLKHDKKTLLFIISTQLVLLFVAEDKKVPHLIKWKSMLKCSFADEWESRTAEEWNVCSTCIRGAPFQLCMIHLTQVQKMISQLINYLIFYEAKDAKDSSIIKRYVTRYTCWKLITLWN